MGKRKLFMDEGLRKGCYLEIDETDDRWKNFDPAKESDMDMVGHRVTVCELLREIYKSSTDPQVRIKCRMAVTMSKKMALLITETKGPRWGNEYYPWNPARRNERVKAKFGDRKPKGKEVEEGEIK